MVEIIAVARYRKSPRFRLEAVSYFSLRVSFPASTVTRAEVRMKIISIR